MFHERKPLFLRFPFILTKADRLSQYLNILGRKLVKGMKWFRKKKTPLHFEDAARFNWVLDTNQELQDGMTRLAEQFPSLTEESYTQKALELFRKAGLELSAEELKMLLALRRETDQMLLRKKGKDE